MTKRRGGRRKAGVAGWLHQVLLFLRRLVEAFRHVQTGGRSTETKARRRAMAPPARCPECQQEVHHSTDWRDHIHDEDQAQADQAPDQQ